MLVWVVPWHSTVACAEVPVDQHCEGIWKHLVAVYLSASQGQNFLSLTNTTFEQYGQLFFLAGILQDSRNKTAVSAEASRCSASDYVNLLVWKMKLLVLKPKVCLNSCTVATETISLPGGSYGFTQARYNKEPQSVSQTPFIPQCFPPGKLFFHRPQDNQSICGSSGLSLGSSIHLALVVGEHGTDWPLREEKCPSPCHLNA